jgi:hypothetical protein
MTLSEAEKEKKRDRDYFDSSVAVEGGGGSGFVDCGVEKKDDKVLKTVFCLFGSKVNTTTSEVGCS